MSVPMSHRPPWGKTSCTPGAERAWVWVWGQKTKLLKTKTVQQDELEGAPMGHTWDM